MKLDIISALKELGQVALQKFKDAAGPEWKRLSAEHQEMAERALTEGAELQIRAVAGDEEAKESLEIRLQTLSNLGLIGGIAANRVAKQALVESLYAAASIAAKLLLP